MALVQCPSCSAQVSHLAAACPRCGYPIAVPPPPPRSNTRTGIIIALVVAVVLGGGVVVVGILAAIAIPRFATAANQARESAARTELREIYALQQARLAETGEYSANLHDPTGADFLGWDGALSSDYDYAVSFAAGGGLCIEAIPAEHLGPGVRVLSMDVEGVEYQSASCRGEPSGGEMMTEEGAAEAYDDAAPSGLEQITPADESGEAVDAPSGLEPITPADPPEEPAAEPAEGGDAKRPGQMTKPALPPKP